jgi:putative peptidoglycan lipid II flippase
VRVKSRFIQQSLLAATVITIGTSVLSRLFGYVREAAVAGYFGTSATLDTFVIAFTVPEILGFMFFASLPLALLPVLKNRRLEDKEDISPLFWSGMFVVAILTGLIALTIFLFRDSLIIWLAPGLTGEELQLARRLSTNLAWFVLFRGMEAYFRSWLLAYKHFIIPSLSAIVINVVVLGTIFLLYDELGIDTLVYGWLVASIIAMIFNGLSALAVIRPHFRVGRQSAWVRLLFRAITAVALVELITLLYPVIDRYLASRLLGDGQIAALRFATFLIQVPTGVIVVTFAYASFPWITEMASEVDSQRARDLYGSSIRLIVWVMGLVMIGVLIFPNDIVRLAFGRGAFDEASMSLTTGPLACFAAGIMFHSVYIYQMRFYYARAARLRLGIILLGMLAVKVIGSLLLVGPLEHSGLALATSIAWTTGFVAMSIDLKRHLGTSLLDLFLPGLPKLLLSLAIVASVWMTLNYLWPMEVTHTLLYLFFRLAVIGLTGIVIFLGLSHWLKIPAYKRLTERFRSGSH